MVTVLLSLGLAVAAWRRRTAAGGWPATQKRILITVRNARAT
jgi:hypothetical protein